MPKEICTNNYFFYYCYVNDTKKEFQLEKDFITYIKRHNKFCKCSFLPANENNYQNRRRIDLNVLHS